LGASATICSVEANKDGSIGTAKWAEEPAAKASALSELFS
jgi:hypothetical protein